MTYRPPSRRIIGICLTTLLAVAVLPSVDAAKSPLAGCKDYAFQYTDGHTDVGRFCDGNDIESGLHVNSLHVSCSDKFPNGVSEGKSDLAGHVIEAWSIKKYDDKGEVDKECGSFGNPPSDPSRADCAAYDFLYTDGHRDTGVFCDGNDIKSGLHVKTLHVSCSDSFPGGVSEGKSDLDGHRIASWSIIKYDGDGDIKKVCGSGAPPCPPDADATAQRDGSISLDWSDVQGALLYRVYRGTGTGPLVSIANVTDSNFTDTATLPGITYRYRVTSVGVGAQQAIACPLLEVTAIPFFGTAFVAGLAMVGVVGSYRLMRRRD